MEIHVTFHLQLSLFLFLLLLLHWLMVMRKSFLRSTLQRKSHLCIPRKGIAWPQSLFHIHVSVRDLYIPKIGPHISLL